MTKVGWLHAKDINYAKHFWHFSWATWPPCMHFPISIFIFYFAIDFFDTWYGYSFNYQACILLYFLWFLDFFLILFKGNFVQIIKYFLRSILHWRFSKNSVRYKDFTTHNHANEFVRELLVFFAAISRNLVHNFLWHTIWKAKFTIVGKGCIKERKWANPIPPRQGYFLSPW